MKWILKVGIFFFFSTFSWAGEAIRLTTGEFVPFTSKSLKYNGVISRIVTEAFALEGGEVEYGWYPWKRACPSEEWRMGWFILLENNTRKGKGFLF